MFIGSLLRRRCCMLVGIVAVALAVCSSQVSLVLAATGCKVEYLPGLEHEGPLPFELQTGYIGVDKLENVQLFYYFVKSESHPNTDPLVLWISGGPCCSSFYSMTQENGPLILNKPKDLLKLPTLSINPYSWTKVASIIYLDLPVGTGFSYAKTSEGYISNTTLAGDHAAEFIRKWLEHHPEYKFNPFYVGGDSWSGVIIPIVAHAISSGIEAGLKPHINFNGYILGNPMTFSPEEHAYIIPHTHGLGLISDELYESLEAAECIKDPKTCSHQMKKFRQLTIGVLGSNSLDHNCVFLEETDTSSGHSHIPMKTKKFLGYNVHAFDPFVVCFGELIASKWANDYSVQDALHVRKGSIEKWMQCNCKCRESYFEVNVKDARPYHAILSTKGYRSLIFSGDHDLFVPSISTEAWIKSLNYSIIDDWRPWWVNAQIVGYTRTFSNKMTYAKVKGAGHLAPTSMPLECLVMFKRWLSYEPL